MVVTPMQASVFHLDLIRGDDPHSFTRKRHISVIDLIYQMLNRKGGSQWSDVMDYYQDLGKKQLVTETAFYLARKRVNPQAMRIMSNEFIANYYDNEADSFKKWKGNLVLAVDGSKIKGKSICIWEDLCIYKPNKKSIKTCWRTFISPT